MTVTYATECVGPAYGAEGGAFPPCLIRTIELCGLPSLAAQPGTRAGRKEATEGPQKGKTGEGGVTGVAVLQFLAADWGQQDGGSCFPGVDALAEGGSDSHAASTAQWPRKYLKLKSLLLTL